MVRVEVSLTYHPNRRTNVSRLVRPPLASTRELLDVASNVIRDSAATLGREETEGTQDTAKTGSNGLDEVWCAEDSGCADAVAGNLRRV